MVVARCTNQRACFLRIFITQSRAFVTGSSSAEISTIDSWS